MGKIQLQIRAQFENLSKLTIDRDTFVFHFRLICTKCRDPIPNVQSIAIDNLQAANVSKSGTSNYQVKCKLCNCVGSMTIVKDSFADYDKNDQGLFKTLVTFDCRGIEPVEFLPRHNWIAHTETQTFNDCDLMTRDWVDFDTDKQCSVGVFEFESRFL